MVRRVIAVLTVMAAHFQAGDALACGRGTQEVDGLCVIENAQVQATSTGGLSFQVPGATLTLESHGCDAVSKQTGPTVEDRLTAMAAELKAVQTDNAALRASLGLKEASDNTKPDSIDRPADCQAIRDIQSIIPADGHFHIYPHGPTNRKVYVYCDFEGNDGWTVLIGEGNAVNNCEFIQGDCDEAANGHAVSGLVHGGPQGGDKTAGPSNGKFCCSSKLAIADQVSYHREFCGHTGGYNNAAVRFCIGTSWLAGLPIREVRLRSVHSSKCGQPWGFSVKSTSMVVVAGYNKDTATLVGDDKFHVADVSAADGALLSVNAETGCPGKVDWKYFGFRL